MTQSAITVHDILSSVSKFDLFVEMWKRREFAFITDKTEDDKTVRHEQLHRALMFMTDDETEELTYGGGAGGSKTWGGCCFSIFMCSAFPRIKGFIARNELTKIMSSTLITFHKVAQAYGCTSYRFNAQRNFIQFDNGSRIDLINTAYTPRETYESRFGSSEYTFGWLEEGSEQRFDAYDTLKSRLGRHLNDHYDLKPFMLITCNPAKTWTYRIYKDAKTKKIGRTRKFLKALAIDNPFIESGYIDQLEKIEDKAKKRRLLHGDWEYEDEEGTLCSYDDILAVFDDSSVTNERRATISLSSKKTITADIARQGSDKAVIMTFAILDDVSYVIELETYEKSKTTLIQERINLTRAKHNIDKDRAIADEDGLGAGVVDNCDIRGFLNNAKPLKEKTGTKHLPTYANLQTQCAYKLARRVKERRLKFLCDVDTITREQIIEELEQLKADKVEDDKKYFIKNKDDIKRDIGRSPDFRDALLMNEVFFIKKERKRPRVTSS